MSYLSVITRMADCRTFFENAESEEAFAYNPSNISPT